MRRTIGYAYRGSTVLFTWTVRNGVFDSSSKPGSHEQDRDKTKGGDDDDQDCTSA